MTRFGVMALLCMLARTLLYPTVSSAVPINAISQPSFEVDDGSWVIGFNATPHGTGVFPPLTGNTGTYWARFGGSGWLSQTLLTPVPGSQVTQLQMYATVWSASSQPTATLEVTLSYQTGPTTSVQQLVESIDEWILFDFGSAVDPSRVITSIRLDHLEPGYLAVDDVALLYEPVPEPSTILLLGLGLTGMAVPYRRCRSTRRCS